MAGTQAWTGNRVGKAGIGSDLGDNGSTAFGQQGIKHGQGFVAGFCCFNFDELMTEVAQREVREAAVIMVVRDGCFGCW